MRCTMPGRCASPTDASSGYRASSPCTSVPVRLPAPGCTTRPAGLFSTRRSSSSWTTSTGMPGSPTRGESLCSGAAWISRADPSSTRTEPFAMTAPSSRTAPAAISAVASARVQPVSNATMRSTRSPTSAAGTSGTVRRSGEHQEDAADRDRHVGNVEDRPPLRVDEVDHAAAKETRALAKRAIDEVPDRAAEHQTEAQHAELRVDAPTDDEEDDHDDDGEDRDQSAAPESKAERRPPVASQMEPKRPEQIDVARRERVDRPRL